MGFTIPYRHRGLLSRYIPDFIVVTDREESIVVEIKGPTADDAGTRNRSLGRDEVVGVVLDLFEPDLLLEYLEEYREGCDLGGE